MKSNYTGCQLQCGVHGIVALEGATSAAFRTTGKYGYCRLKPAFVLAAVIYVHSYFLNSCAFSFFKK